MTIELTREELARWVSYNPDTGEFTWLKKPNRRIRVGSGAGSLQPHGYIRFHVNGRPVLAHRAAWLITYGTWPTGEVDHANGARNDNRIANLRDASPSEQRQNVASRNTSGYIGVQPSGRGFIAVIRSKGQIHRLGQFPTAEAAAEAYRAAKKRLHSFQPILREGVR